MIDVNEQIVRNAPVYISVFVWTSLTHSLANTFQKKWVASEIASVNGPCGTFIWQWLPSHHDGECSLNACMIQHQPPGIWKGKFWKWKILETENFENGKFWKQNMKRKSHPFITEYDEITWQVSLPVETDNSPMLHPYLAVCQWTQTCPYPRHVFPSPTGRNLRSQTHLSTEGHLV